MVSTRLRRQSQNRRSSEAGLASATAAESMGEQRLVSVGFGCGTEGIESNRRGELFKS